MATTVITPTFSADDLRKAFHGRDAAGLLALYAPDATIEIVDARNTPSSPKRIEGRDAIRAHHEDVFSRDMTHEVEIVAVSPEALGYSIRCRYGDGTRVVCAATAELRNGKIVREVGVQAWDGAS